MTRPLHRLWRPLALALGLAAVLLAAGCGPRSQPFSPQQASELRTALVRFQELPEGQAESQLRAWQRELGTLRRAQQGQEQAARLQYLIAYADERLFLFEEALDSYRKVSGPYLPLASFRQGEIQLLVNKNKRAAGGLYSRAAMAPAGALAYYPAVGSGAEQQLALASQRGARIREFPLVATARRRLDEASRDRTLYKVVQWLVNVLGARPRYSYALALLLLAVVVKVLTTPFTMWAFRSMRNMQRLEPLRRELQAKYKDDQATLAREQMRLFKKYKVSPLGGCLPLLIQMPILYYVYQAIQVYIYQFSLASFLWIRNLAGPDYPLLLLYAFSMYVSQKLTAMPAADPQQQQMQNTMALMMPVMFTFLFASLPSAFILYWFAYNVLITGHQYLLMRRPLPSLEEEAQAAPPAGPAPARPQRIRRKK